MTARRYSWLRPRWAAATFGATALSVSVLAMAAGADAPLAAQANAITAQPAVFHVTTMEVSRGDTLHELLEASGVVSADAERVSDAITQRIRPGAIRAGNHLVLEFANDTSGPQLQTVKLELGADELLELRRNSDGVFSDDAENPAPLNTLPGLVTLKVQRGDTIASVLTDQNIHPVEVDRAVRALRKRFNPRRLKVGQSLSVLPGPALQNGGLELAGLGVHLKDGRVVEVVRNPQGKFAARRSSRPTFAWGTPQPTARPGDAGRESAIAPTPETQDAEEAVTAASTPDEPAGDAATAQAPETAVERQAATGEPAKTEARSDESSDVHTVRVRPGDTVGAILEGAGVSPRQKDLAVRKMRRHFNPRRLKVGQEILVLTTPTEKGHRLDGFAIRLGAQRYVEVTANGKGGFTAARVQTPQLARATSPAAEQPSVTAKAKPAAVATAQDSAADAADSGERASPSESPSVSARSTAATDGAATHIRPVWRPSNFERREFAMTAAAVAGAAPIEQPTARESSLVADALTPQARAPEPQPGDFHKEVVIARGDTLFTALARAGTSNSDAEAVIRAFRKVSDPRRLQIGQVLTLGFEGTGNADDQNLASLAMNINPERDLLIERDSPDTFLGREIERPVHRHLSHADGVIMSSLYLAAKGAGLPNEVLMEMVHIFGFAVDFQRDVQSGDHFEVLYEQLDNDRGESVGQGPVLYASITLSGTQLELFRYEGANGGADYFEPTGKSVRRALMRTPINGARLSSGYGMRRHPVLGYSKMHRGLDFAAPRGTPIMAAGDGTIERIGRYGNYGKYIRIRHNGTYSTAYAHMSGYAKGLKRGSRVRQGQVIGYVGSTGRSTGPHLHYEIISGGKQMNPRKVKLPSGRQLEEAEVAAFHSLVRKVRIMLAETSSDTRLAASD